MADDPSKVGKQDDVRVNIHQDHEVQYWSERLGVTPEALKEAVREAGPMVKDVRKALGK